VAAALGGIDPDGDNRGGEMDAAAEDDLTVRNGDRDAGPSEHPWRWMGEATGIYRRHWALSAGYGLLFVLLGYGIGFLLRGAGMAAAMPVAIGAFALAGPLMAVGLYTVAKADEEGRRVRFREVLFPRAASPLQIAYLAVMILVAVLLWIIAAIGLFAIFAGQVANEWSAFISFALSTPAGITMVIVGTLVGGFVAATIFVAAAFSVPMLMDRPTDFASAVGQSVQTVLQNPKAMLLWAWIILLSVAVSAATLLIGFALLFPLLGYATWRGYRTYFPEVS
jgi:uncharacterized membrane protein